MQNVNHIEGENRGRIFLFAISTCAWCKKTKRLLADLGVEYDYIDVDLLDGPEKDKVKKEHEKWNPAGSFPTLIIGNSKCIVGYEPQKIRKELGT